MSWSDPHMPMYLSSIDFRINNFTALSGEILDVLLCMPYSDSGEIIL